MRVTLLLLLLLSAPAVAQAQTCRAPERVQGAAEYNRMVCDAVSRFEAKDYASAADLLERASKLELYEYPNYRVLPRLALTYAHLGKSEQARILLAQVRLSLEVLYRLSRCIETSNGFGLVDERGPLPSDSSTHAVVARMCGEVYQGLYEQSNLDSLSGDLPLIQMYFEAKSVLGPF